MIATRLAVAALLLLGPSTACDEDDSVSDAGGGGFGGGGAPPAATGGGGSGGEAGFVLVVDWSPCPLDSTKASGTDAECATIAVPLDWNAPAGETIALFVKRWPVLPSPPAAHIWLVQGGPGSASVEWEARVNTLSGSFPSAQFYMHDPRGVGRSSRLGCPAQEDATSDGGLDVTLAEWPSCIATVEAMVGAGLAHFTIEQSARDLGELVRGISPGVPATLFGQSYGTLLLQRYLHLYPGQAAAVVLDSLANPPASFTSFSEGADRVGHDFLHLCGTDSACSARLGPDPAALVDDVFSSAVDAGGCAGLAAAGGTRYQLARLFYGLLAFKEYRAVIFPALLRLQRCNAADVDALTTMLGLLESGAPSLADQLHGQVLYTHLVLSEIWDASPPEPAMHLEELQTLEFGIIDTELDELWADRKSVV